MRLGLGGGVHPTECGGHISPLNRWVADGNICSITHIEDSDNQGGGNFPNLVYQGVQWLTEVTTIDDAGGFTGAEGQRGGHGTKRTHGTERGWCRLGSGARLRSRLKCTKLQWQVTREVALDGEGDFYGALENGKKMSVKASQVREVDVIPCIPTHVVLVKKGTERPRNWCWGNPATRSTTPPYGWWTHR